MKRVPKDLDRHRPRKDGMPRKRRAESRFSNQDVEGFGPDEAAAEEAFYERQLAIAKERAGVDSHAVPMNANEDFVVPFDFLDDVFHIDGKNAKVFLTPQQKIAICEFLSCLNYEQAMLRAGYSPSYSRHNHKAFFSRPLVQHAMKIAMRYRMEQLALSPERVFDELASLGFSDMSDIAEIVDGRLHIKDTAGMSRRARHAIAEITETRNNQGTTIKVRMHDKLGALTQLARALGMNQDKVQIEDNRSAADTINAARERVINARKASGQDADVAEAEYTDVTDEQPAGGTDTS